MGTRGVPATLAVMVLTALYQTPASAEEPPVDANLIANPSFERSEDGASAERWGTEDFGTGGAATVGRDGGRTGQAYAALSSATARQRACFVQECPLPEGTRFVVASGYYRNRGVTPGVGGAATFRVHFYAAPGRRGEIGLRQVFFPAAENWTFSGVRVFPVPEGTRTVALQVFHWLLPGETHWDDVELRPLRPEESEAAREALAAGLGIDREPVAGTNVPYSPADGSVPRVNPPPFLWLPADGADRYVLEISRDARCEDPTLRLTGLKWCARMLTEPLDPGVWYWRYGVEVPGTGVAYSRVRAFRVSPEADPWPFPGPDALQVPTRRPRLFAGAIGTRTLRTRSTDGDLREVADRLRAAVQRYAGEDLVAEPDRLPDDPALRGAAYTLTFRETRPPMDRMEQAALAYLLTGDPEAGREAVRRILHFFSWDPRGATGVFHNDEPAMWVMMRGVRAYDWTRELLSDAERATVEACIRVRARDFYDKLRRRPFENNPYESHAGRILGFLGEAALLLAPEDAEAREWLEYVATVFWGVYPAWGGEDGGWNEGPGYWSAYMDFGLHFVVALREATGIDLSRRPFFRNTPYYKLYLTPPYSAMAPFGDGSQFRPSRPGSLMYRFSSLLQDPHIRWYADALGQGPGDGILGVVLRDDTLKGVPPLGLPDSRYFPSVGLVCLHSAFGSPEDDAAFSMRSSPYGAVSHGHNDQNCFVLEAFGEPLAVATGHYNRYGSPHHDGWTRQTKAKCGITVDGGRGQDRGWQARGSIRAFFSDDRFDYVHADATPAYGGRLTRAVRKVIHLRPAVFVVLDELASGEPRVFEYNLHAPGDAEPDVSLPDVFVRRPKATLRTTVLEPGDVNMTKTDAFDLPPTWPPGQTWEQQWHLRAATPAPSRSAVFLTVLCPARAGQEGELPQLERLRSDKALGVRVRYADGSRAVAAFATGGPGSSVGALLGDEATGEAAALVLDPQGNVQARFVAGEMLND